MSDLHMWSYWRDDKGFECAIEEYFAATLESDKELKRLYSHYKDYKTLVNLHMERLQIEAEDNLEDY